MAESKQELYKLGIVYDAIAKMLPVEGKDYNMEVTFDEGGQLNVGIVGLTTFGKVFASYCMQNMQTAIQEVIHDRQTTDELIPPTE